MAKKATIHRHQTEYRRGLFHIYEKHRSGGKRMRKVLVLRGAPGAGKTTWIKGKKLVPYTLSFDNIRMLYQSPIQTIYGRESTCQKANVQAYDTLFSILEERMKNGEFTVIDCVNSKKSQIQKYQELAQKYRYELYVIDFTTVPIDVAKSRNIRRSARKRVPDSVVENTYNEFKKDALSDKIKVIKPDEIDSIYEKPVDLSKYKKIHHIGDIHGCDDVLKRALNDNGNLREDEFYIFLGDYTDKGPHSDRILEFLLSIKNKHNVILCEGNHEHWIWNWSNGIEDYSEEFMTNTLPQLNDINKKDIRKLYRQLKECFIYTYKEKNVLNTHGGLATIPEHIDYISGHQMIHGVGLHIDLPCISKTFADSMPPNWYEVFGHRNPGGLTMNSGNRVYFLENGIDVGGTLRWLTLDGGGFHEKEYDNVSLIKKETA